MFFNLQINNICFVYYVNCYNVALLLSFIYVISLLLLTVSAIFMRMHTSCAKFHWYGFSISTETLNFETKTITQISINNLEYPSTFNQNEDFMVNVFQLPRVAIGINPVLLTLCYLVCYCNSEYFEMNTDNYELFEETSTSDFG